MDKIVLVPGWIKDFVPVVVSIAVFCVAWSQKRLAREQLRHQLYNRRIVIYDAFQELLFALLKSDDEIRALFQKVDFTRREVPFLFNDSQKLQDFLRRLCKEVTDEVINNKEDLKVTAADTLYDKDNPKLEKNKRHEAAKLKIKNDYSAQLLEQFGPFLKLTDRPTIWR